MPDMWLFSSSNEKPSVSIKLQKFIISSLEPFRATIYNYPILVEEGKNAVSPYRICISFLNKPSGLTDNESTMYSCDK